MLTLLLISMLTLAFNIQAVETESTTTLSICPQESSAAPGETFSVNVTVTNVTDLYGWQIMIHFNSTILNASSLARGPFLETAGLTLWQVWEITHPGEPYGTIDNTMGYITVGDVLNPPFPPSGATGNGTLVTITFLVKARGITQLSFVEDPTFTYLSTVMDNISVKIPHDKVNGVFDNRVPYETRLWVRESPPGSWVPGVPVGGWVWLTVDIESPFEWDNTSKGIVGYVFSVHVNPDVLEVNSAYAATFGYFLFDFIDVHCFFGHEPALLIEEINATTGDIKGICELIMGFLTLGIGAGGSSGTPGWYGETFGLCRLRFESKNETAYTRIDLHDAYLVRLNASAPEGYSKIPFDVVDDAHYNEPPPLHNLTVESTPIDGIDFTIDSGSYTTNATVQLEDGTYTVAMPSPWTVGPDQYNFLEWEDHTTNPVRTISLTSDMTIIAIYELQVWSTDVYFNLNPNPVSVGETVTLKGVLVDEFCQPLDYETVELYARPLAGSWRHITSLTTNDYGTFTWQATIPLQGIFIFAVYYPGNETYRPCYNFAALIVQ